MVVQREVQCELSFNRRSRKKLVVQDRINVELQLNEERTTAELERPILADQRQFNSWTVFLLVRGICDHMFIIIRILSLCSLFFNLKK